MNEKTKTGLEILQAAVLLGVLGDVLLRATPWGLNVFLFVGAFAAAMLMLVLRRKSEFFSRQTMLLQASLVFFAAMFVWRDSIELKIYNSFAIFTILAVLCLPALKIKPHLAGGFHYLLGFVWSGINAAFALFALVFSDIKWKTIPQTGWSKHLISVLRGLAIAAPLVLIFGALFVAADAVFQGIVENSLNIDGEKLFLHIFFVGFFSWVTAGYLRGAILGNLVQEAQTELFASKSDETKTPNLSITEVKEDDSLQTKAKPAEEKQGNKSREWQNFDNSVLPPSFTLGAIEISIVLGLINLLFFSFVIVQIPYLFGGMELVQNTPDFKLAEYARRGFGELVTVAALVLPILLISHWLLRKDNSTNEKIYRVLAGVQILLLFVIMISAAQRLFLLTGNLGYGLTTVRFYPMVVMIWLALVFIWFALTVLRGVREQFAWGALWLALFVLGTLHVFNPDEFIVRTNVRLMKEGRSFDTFYNSDLSDDAVPVLIENLSSVDFAGQCVIKDKLAQRLQKAETETDFRSWNVSRRRARIQTSEIAGDLDTTNCPQETKRHYHHGDF
jgi:hypothetical protein